MYLFFVGVLYFNKYIYLMYLFFVGVLYLNNYT